MKWPVRQLRDFIDIKHGFAFSGRNFARSGKYVVLTPGNFHEKGGFRSQQDKERFLNGDPPADYILEEGALVVAMTEQAPGLLGSCAAIPEGDRFLHNQRLGLVEIKRPQELHRDFLMYTLNSPAVRQQIHRSAGGMKVRHTSPTKIGATWFTYPPVKDQEIIAKILVAVDAVLSVIGRAIVAKRAYKRGLMQQLFSGERRFPEFVSREWVIRSFAAICDELSERNGGQLGADSVMGVIKDVGFQPMRDRVRGMSGLDRYKVVPPEAFAFNPMRLNIGSIAHNGLGRAVLVSPDYVVFRTRPAMGCATYINQLRSSALWADFMSRAGSGSVRTRIYFSDLARMQVPAPDIDEQQRIAALLDTMDHEIRLLEAHGQQFGHYKSGFLSHLLSA